MPVVQDHRDGGGGMSGGAGHESDGEPEEMDHSSAANESDNVKGGSSDGADSSEDSGSEDSSDMDEEECEHRRAECLDDMVDLERQFSFLKEQWVASLFRKIIGYFSLVCSSLWTVLKTNRSPVRAIDIYVENGNDREKSKYQT